MEEMFEAVERDLVPQTQVIMRLFPSIVAPAASSSGLLSWCETPARMVIDFHETDEDYQLHADLPGFRNEDMALDIDSETRRLNLSEERKRRRKEKGRDEERGPRYHFAEHSHGKCSRSIGLPKNIDVEKVDANYSYGVLAHTFPKKEVLAPYKIPIKFFGEEKEKDRKEADEENKVGNK